MTIELPAVIAAYFAADQTRNPQTISECFTPDAVVVDEGNIYTGRDAIRQWMESASTQYSYTVQPLSLSEDGARIVVTGNLVGNFPGSPVDLRYMFKLDGDKIAALEILP